MSKEKNLTFINRFIEITGKGETQATQDDIAQKVGTSRQNVGNWLSGKTQPDIKALAAIAKAYNVSTDYLLGLTDVQSPDTDIQAICNYTGLSEKAIEQICQYKDFNNQMFSLNRLLECNSLFYILIELYDLFKDSKAVINDIPFIGEQLKSLSIDEEIILEFHENENNCDLDRYKLSMGFLKILDMFDYRIINKTEYHKLNRELLEKELSEYKKNPRPNDEHSDGE